MIPEKDKIVGGGVGGVGSVGSVGGVGGGVVDGVSSVGSVGGVGDVVINWTTNETILSMAGIKKSNDKDCWIGETYSGFELIINFILNIEWLLDDSWLMPLFANI